MNIEEMNDELNMLRLKVLRKIDGANIHKAANLLESTRMIIDEYSATKNKAWLKIYNKAKKELINFLDS